MTEPTNGTALAALLAAAIGAGAMGLVVIANEAGLFSAPAVYGPAGGVSGRTTLAVVIWLASWGVLHTRWRHRQMAARRVQAWSLALILLGAVLTFPPVWAIF